jgi:hypothetical protein
MNLILRQIHRHFHAFQQTRPGHLPACSARAFEECKTAGADDPAESTCTLSSAQNKQPAGHSSAV